MTAVHRENQPPIDLEAVEKRCDERDAAIVGWTTHAADITRGDTEIIRQLVGECRALRIANAVLRKRDKGTSVP